MSKNGLELMEMFEKYSKKVIIDVLKLFYRKKFNIYNTYNLSTIIKYVSIKKMNLIGVCLLLNYIKYYSKIILSNLIITHLI